ncbi:quinone oxidoreductase [Kribbella capetownensis]|uniref:Quinone oxidoreductase n=1 Tax=Kribbella capetownensis TaxID=1572659 RepID=A0A4R0JR47_9ACTN|nr:zinc-binding dehydrogenase [Kribbella capetownensis]TCC49833.1 quinone oxidoreductase [Kribbella capetownensis]
MRALAFRTNGGPEVFEEIDRPVPAAGDGQVLIQVAYAGVNFAEVQHRRGEFGAPDGPDGYDVPGLEVSGVIAAIGAGVGGLTEGEAVAAYLPGFGGYAEYAVADATFVRPIGGVPAAVAAGLPCVFPTAYGVLHDAGRLRAGDTVLIHAAAGGVGSAAARIARTLGADRIFGTVGSADKLALAGSLGYDALFSRDDFAGQVLDATDGGGADLVLDPVGGPVRTASLEALAPFGRVVVYGDLGRHEDWTADVWDLWKTNKAIAGFNIGDLARRSPATIGDYLADALSALESGGLTLPDPQIEPLAAASAVHQQLESATTSGKTVFRVA